MRPFLVKNFISKEVAEECVNMLDVAVDEGKTEKDSQCPLSQAIYGLHKDLLDTMTDKMSELTEYEVLPTYTYCRRYEENDILKPHTDRPSCEISVTICLKNEVAPWAFHWVDGTVMMEAGDAVVYPGWKYVHWREPNDSGGRVWQVFLHYVDKNGPYAKQHAYEQERKGI